MKKIAVCLLAMFCISLTSCRENEKVTVEVNVNPTGNIDFSKIEGAWKNDDETRTIILSENSATDSYMNLFSTVKVSYELSKNPYFPDFIAVINDKAEEYLMVKPAPDGKLIVAYDRNIIMTKTTVADIERIKSDWQNKKPQSKPITNLVPWK